MVEASRLEEGALRLGDPDRDVVDLRDRRGLQELLELAVAGAVAVAWARDAGASLAPTQAAAITSS
jgi:hypothetical protein